MCFFVVKYLHQQRKGNKMKYYTVKVKNNDGSLTHVRSFYKKQDAQEHLEFFAKESKETFVIVECIE